MNKLLAAARAAALSGLVAATGAASAQTLQLPPALIRLDSEAGAQLLIDSQARRAYWPLSVQFVTQKNQAYCGVASMVMVLNLLNERTEAILPQATLMKQGMTLTQLGRILGAHAVAVTVTHAGDDGLEAFRKAASRQLAAPGAHVIVNYLRRTIGQETGGHISPLAAYDERSDRFLILDVSRYKYPPADLYAAMNTVDRDNEGRRRGWVLVGP